MKPRYLPDRPNKQHILDLCMDMALELGPDVFEKQSRALQNRRDQTETLRGARLPTLILCGEVDILCPPDRHVFMHKLIDRSTLEIIAGAGHLPTLEEPLATNAALSRWLCDDEP
jgi:pimeloyl-ACP methyl ester carboxylesterase